MKNFPLWVCLKMGKKHSVIFCGCFLLFFTREDDDDPVDVRYTTFRTKPERELPSKCLPQTVCAIGQYQILPDSGRHNIATSKLCPSQSWPIKTLEETHDLSISSVDPISVSCLICWWTRHVSCFRIDQLSIPIGNSKCPRVMVTADLPRFASQNRPLFPVKSPSLNNSTCF